VATSHKEVTAYPTVTQQLGLLSFRWHTELVSLCWCPQAPRTLTLIILEIGVDLWLSYFWVTGSSARRGNGIKVENNEKQLWKTVLMTQREADTKVISFSGIRTRQKLHTNTLSFSSGTWLKVSGCLFNTASSTAPHTWLQAT